MITPMFTFALSATLVLAFTAIRHIPKGQVYTLRRFGRSVRTIGPGTHFVMPLVEKVAHKISLLGQTTPVHAVLKYPQGSRVLRGEIFYQVLDAERADAVIDGVAELLQQRAFELMMERVELSESAQMRDDQIKRSLNYALRDSGILVTRVQLNIQ